MTCYPIKYLPAGLIINPSLEVLKAHFLVNKYPLIKVFKSHIFMPAGDGTSSCEPIAF